MTALRIALSALTVLAGVAMAAPPAGGPPPGVAPPGGGARPGGPPPGGRPPGTVPPRHGAYPGGNRGYWHGPSVGIYYGGAPYWGVWGWPGAYWPSLYWSGYYRPGYYYGPGYGYLPPTTIYGPPGVVTATAGVVYIEREPGTVSTQQPEPAPEPDATPAMPPPPGAQWWYLCNSPRGAYPYVRECPGGWERVPAIPPDQAK